MIENTLTAYTVIVTHCDLPDLKSVGFNDKGEAIAFGEKLKKIYIFADVYLQSYSVKHIISDDIEEIEPQQQQPSEG